MNNKGGCEEHSTPSRGVVLYSQAGALPQPALENLVQALRDVDMDDVKKKLAEDSASDPS